MWYVFLRFACILPFSLFHWSYKSNKWRVSRQVRRRSSQQPVSASWERLICRGYLIHLGAAGNRRTHRTPGTPKSSWSCRVRSWSTCCRLLTRGTIWGLRRCPEVWRNWIRFREELQLNSCSVARQCPLCNPCPSSCSCLWWFEACLLILVMSCLCLSLVSNAWSFLEL